MLIHGILTLAAGAGEALVLAIMFGIVIISWVVKQVRKLGQGTAGSGQSAADQTRLAELARQRREELLRMAGRETTGAEPPADRPANMSMNEYAARQQARNLYERRAEALRRQRSLSQQASVSPAPPPLRPAPVAPRVPMSVQRAPQPLTPPPPLRPQPVQRPPAPVRQAPARPASAAPRSPAAAPRPSARAAGTTIARDTELVAREARRTVKDDQPEVIELDDHPLNAANEESRRPRAGDALRKVLTSRSIRTAMVLKEILDPPLALRRPETPGS